MIVFCVKSPYRGLERAYLSVQAEICPTDRKTVSMGNIVFCYIA
jgi:hypothetical protein